MYSCLFTHQLSRKKKTWQDGVLKVNFGAHRVQLFRGDRVTGDLIGSMRLEDEQLSRFRSGDEIEFEIARHLVQFDTSEISNQVPQVSSSQTPTQSTAPNHTTNRNSSTPKVTKVANSKRRKFKAPARVSKPKEPEKSKIENIYDHKIQFSTLVASTDDEKKGEDVVNGSYSVSGGELDDIWGENGENKKRTSPLLEKVENDPPTKKQRKGQQVDYSQDSSNGEGHKSTSGDDENDGSPVVSRTAEETLSLFD